MATTKKKKAKAPATKSVKDVVEAFNKASNSTEIVLIDDNNYKKNIPKTSSGSLKIDQASGIGGYPQGRLIEVIGPESSGKTTMVLMAIAEAQKNGNICSFIDAEHALDLKYAEALGVDVKSLLITQPDCGEDALNAAESLTGILTAGDIIAIDSVAALTPRAEIEGEAGDHHMGLHARLMSQACRKLTGTASKRGVTIFFINQIRMKIGVMFGSPETTTGGNALKFYASQRIDVRRIGSEKDKKGNIISNKIRTKFIKNKVAPPFREAETIIQFGIGIPKVSEIVDFSEEFGLLTRSGAWYYYQDTKIAQGKANAADYLRNNPEIMDYLEAEIRKKLEIEG